VAKNPMLRVGEEKNIVCLVCLFEQILFTARFFYYSPAPDAYQNIRPHFWLFAQDFPLLIINNDFSLL